MKQIVSLMVVLAVFANNLAKADALDTWTLRHTDSSQFLTGISYGHGVYVATGQQGLIMTSPDGITWTTRNSGTTQWVGDVAWANNVFAAVGQGGVILSSPDGINWAPRSSGTTANYNRIKFLNGRFITVGDQSTISTSPDGINWFTQHTGPYTHYEMSYGAGLYIVIGQLDPILISTDATNWTPRYIGANYSGNIAFGNGTFVTSGLGGATETSPDGLTWVSQSPLPIFGFAEVTFGQNNFVGVGSSGVIYSSPDGANWTQRASPVSVNLWNVKYLNGAFWAVGENGTILNDVPDFNKGLVAYYTFNGNANDASGNGNNGVVYNSSLTTDRFGNASSAYNFNGSNSYIDIPQSTSLDLTANFTLSAWIYQRAVQPNGYRIIDKCPAGIADGWSFDTWDGVTGRKLRLQAVAPNNYNVEGSTVYSLMQWHHVVATVSGTVGKVYLDGNLDGTGNVGNIPENTLDIFIGRAHPYGGDSGFNEMFNGVIDDVRIYNRALSDSEVQSLYLSENANPTSVINVNIQTLSTITATPSGLASADGQSKVIATVKLIGAGGQPASGRAVRFYTEGSPIKQIVQPTQLTDTNGQASATITSITPGTVSIGATDLTDSIPIQQKATVQFTSGLVPLDPTLSSAIVQLTTEATTDLPYIGSLAIHQGGCGDYFQQNITADESRRITIGVSFIAGAALAAIQFDPTELGAKTTTELFKNIEHVCGIHKIIGHRYLF